MNEERSAVKAKHCEQRNDNCSNYSFVKETYGLAVYRAGT